MKTDVVKISKTTGFSEEQIKDVKNFIFYEKHDLGGKEPELFEQKIVLYGRNNKPANVVVGWIVNGTETKLTSMYIKER